MLGKTRSRLYMIGNEQFEQIEARLLDHRCRQKAISITYYEFVSIVLIIQHAMRILLSSDVCPALPCFFHMT
jgi:sulfur transfer complex TusBCD TusB component (DsrH family)